ncbi:MAG: DUF554 domain-containing protein [Clostridia bacterium]|nr:DUF554 domain-containing protein [Clostridia bacterium]
MPFLGTIVNFLVVLVAGIVGSLIKKGLPKRIEDGVMSAMAICVVYIGIDGVLEAAPAVSQDSFLSAGLIKVLVMIISMAVGALVGELVDIDRQIGRLGAFLERKLGAALTPSSADGTSELTESGKGNFAKGFVSCSILFCVGAMAVNGALDDAVGKPDILLAKSVIDAISCFVMSASLGIGCAFSAFFVLVYQGAISLLGLGLAEILPAATVSYMSVTGSLIIVLIGTNMLCATKVKTANLTPAIFMPIIVSPLLSLLF